MLIRMPCQLGFIFFPNVALNSCVLSSSFNVRDGCTGHGHCSGDSFVEQDGLV